MKFYLTTVFSLFLVFANAQDMSWRKHAKLAEQLYEQGEYAEAATHYEAAWQKKTKKKEYIYQAAECYAKIKDYRKAAEAYQYVKEDNKDFMLPGLKYARALKQDGQYDEASRSLVYFINGYEGDDKDVVSGIVQDEIKGCELGMSMLENTASTGVEFQHLPDDVNSNKADFAPVPFNDDVLYYTSNMVGETKMYLTQRNAGEWSRARVPKSFPEISASHFGNGAFSPDNKKFYYTQCNGIDATGRMINGCQIYVTSRSDDGWSTPAKMNASINKSGATNTQPYVVHMDGMEMLFFASDRIGGQGGLDIWYTSRELEDSNKFGKPRNLGPTINTMGDEVTPFFDVNENTLYFSSNGQVTIGGFDIFKTTGTEMKDWNAPVNIGLPYNSSADDMFFRRATLESGYLVSNRVYGLSKVSNMDDDIFSFSAEVENMMASGAVMNETTKEEMENVWVAIYEKMVDGKIRLLENKEFTDGNYEFKLLPNKNYRIEANAEGFEAQGVDISTVESDQMSFENDIVIGLLENVVADNASTTVPTGKPNGVYSNPQPTPTMTESGAITSSGSMTEGMNHTTPSTSTIPHIEVDPSAVPGVSNTTTTVVTEATMPTGQTGNTGMITPSSSGTADTNMETTPTYSTSPTYESSSVNTVPSTSGNTIVNSTTTTTSANTIETGVIYRVQLIAVKKFNHSHSRYNGAKSYGELFTEYLPNRNLTRVLLGTFSTKEAADSVLGAMKQQRDFRTAVVVRYENGVRIDPWAK